MSCSDTNINLQNKYPDFYLFSSEGYKLNDVFRACFKRKKLLGPHPDGYLLCDIDPPLIGQPFGLGSQDINKLILSVRHKGLSLHSIAKWPVYVNVARPLIANIENNENIKESDVELIGLAELYENKTG